MNISGDEHINPILDAVRAMSGDGDEQLTILVRAFVVGCRSCGVSQQVALQVVQELFESDDMILVRINN